MLDTSTVSTGRAMTNREVMDLPVLGNNMMMLTRLAPGVQNPGTTQFLRAGPGWRRVRHTTRPAA